MCSSLTARMINKQQTGERLSVSVMKCMSGMLSGLTGRVISNQHKVNVCAPCGKQTTEKLLFTQIFARRVVNKQQKLLPNEEPFPNVCTACGKQTTKVAP